MNIAQSSFKLFSANIVNAAIQFLGIVYFARELGATQMGIFFLFQVVLGLLAIPGDFGLRGAVQKRISEGKSQSKFLASGLVLKLVPVVILSVGVLISRSYIEEYVGTTVAIYLIIALVLQEVSELSVSVLRGELRVGETAVLTVVKNLTWVIVGSIFISFGSEAEALIYGLLAGMGVVTVWGWYKVSIPLSMPTVDHCISLFDYGKYNVVSSVGGYLYSWTDVAIIGLFLTQAHVGAYEIAWRVSAASILFSKAIASTIFPQVSEWSAEKNQAAIEKLLTRSITPSLLLVIPSFFGVLILSEEILLFIFGEEYAIASFVLILLIGDKVFQAFQLIIGKSLQAINKPGLAARAAVFSLSVNIVLNIILVYRYGITGAAVATVLSSFLNDFLHFVYLRRFVTIRFPTQEIVECIISSGMMAILLYTIINSYNINNLSQLFGIILFGVFAYGLTALLMPNLRPRIFDALSRVDIRS